MRLEALPIILGVPVALAGLGLIADGWLPDSEPRTAERRRRARAERDRAGEILVGIGILALATALFGGDVWRWGTVAVLGGLAAIAVGGLRNRSFLAERLLNRGKARRGRRRERRAEMALERPVPLVVGVEDRRWHDRRHGVEEGELWEPPVEAYNGGRGGLATEAPPRAPRLADR